MVKYDQFFSRIPVFLQSMVKFLYYNNFFVVIFFENFAFLFFDHFLPNFLYQVSQSKLFK